MTCRRGLGVRARKGSRKLGRRLMPGHPDGARARRAAPAGTRPSRGRAGRRCTGRSRCRSTVRSPAAAGRWASGRRRRRAQTVGSASCLHCPKEKAHRRSAGMAGPCARNDAPRHPARSRRIHAGQCHRHKGGFRDCARNDMARKSASRRRDGSPADRRRTKEKAPAGALGSWSAPRHSNLSSTAPKLALDEWFANLASTPRV